MWNRKPKDDDIISTYEGPRTYAEVVAKYGEDEALYAWNTYQDEQTPILALAAVRGSRASRSFVAAGANANLPRLVLLHKVIKTDRFVKDCEPVPLMVVDQSGALVPAADFYEWIRQQFCELCALRHAIEENAMYWHFPHQIFMQLWQKLRNEGHFFPIPKTLDDFFVHMSHSVPAWMLHSHTDRLRKRELESAREIFARRLGTEDPLRIIRPYLGGVDLSDATFLPRAELPAVVDHLMATFRKGEGKLGWNGAIRIYAGEQGDEAAWRGVGCQVVGEVRKIDEEAISLRWKIYREGDEMDNEYDDDEMPYDVGAGGPDAMATEYHGRYPVLSDTEEDSDLEDETDLEDDSDLLDSDLDY